MWDTVYLDKTSPPAARPWPRPELIILPQCILYSPNLCFNSRLILLILNCTHWKTAALSSSTILFLSTSHFSVVRCQLQFLAHFRYKPWLRCRSANEWLTSKKHQPLWTWTVSLEAEIFLHISTYLYIHPSTGVQGVQGVQVTMPNLRRGACDVSMWCLVSLPRAITVLRGIRDCLRKL